jgi:hypothetical protein
VAYLDRVEHYRERYRCIVYAYVLMSNHVHLLIETGAVGLPRLFKESRASPRVRIGLNNLYTLVWLPDVSPGISKNVPELVIRDFVDSTAIAQQSTTKYTARTCGWDSQ